MICLHYKHKHLTFEEHGIIQTRLKDGHSPYNIYKELGRAFNAITNEIASSTASQIINVLKVQVYFSDND